MKAQLNITFAGSVVVPWKDGLAATTALLLGDAHCPSLAVDVAQLLGVDPVMKPIAHFVDPAGRHIAIFDLNDRQVSFDGGAGAVNLLDPGGDVLRAEWLDNTANAVLKGDPAKDKYAGAVARVAIQHGTLSALPPPADALTFKFPYLAERKQVASLLRLAIEDDGVPPIVLKGPNGDTTFRFKADCAAADVTISALCGSVTGDRELDVAPWNKLLGTSIIAPTGVGSARIIKNIYTCPPLRVLLA